MVQMTNAGLNKIVKDLAVRVEALEAREVKVHTDAIIAQAENPIQDPNMPPVPPIYRKIVDEVLNPKFGIKIEYMPASFMFTIVVPDAYSSLNEIEKRMIGADLRSKAISYADGENGVRDWVNLVKMSFNPDMQAKIRS